MLRRLISFATPHYASQREYLCITGRPYFDEVIAHVPADLDDDFREANRELLRYLRGYGFWVWKPYLILQHLRKLKRGDVLMYCDSPLAFVADPAPLFELCLRQNGILLFHQKREGHLNRKYTRRECFRRMNCDGPRYWDGPQANTAICVFSPSASCLGFVEEWYGWNRQIEVVGDGICTDNLPEFRDHRHDQSIVSLMAIRDGIQMWPDPSQFGVGYEQPGRNYGQVLTFKRSVSAPYPIPCRFPGYPKTILPA